MYCLVVIDDYSRFTWVFFLATKDETSGILKSFITRIENLVDHKVKVIRCDNRTEFKNREMNQFCEMKGIMRQFSVARTPYQNRVAERRNKTLIKAARTMLADSKCPVTILNTIDHLGKFNGKADEGFYIEYSLNSKAFRVFNSRTRIVKENLHIRFSENTSNIVGSGTDWLFDIDALTRTMNYEPTIVGTQSNNYAGTQSNDCACTKASDNAGQARKEIEPVKDYILLPLWMADLPFFQDLKSSHDDAFKPSSDNRKKVDENPRKETEYNDQEKKDNVNNTNNVNTVSSTVNAVGTNELPFDPNMHALEDVSIFNFFNDDEDDDIVADMNNMDTTIQMDVKSDFLYRKIKEEVYVCQPPGFEDPNFPDKVYKVKKALYGLYQAPKAWYLKGQPKLGLWYPKYSPFDLVAYTDSDYARASLDRKSTTGGCQFLRCRLISWQCKKQIVVANFTPKAEYVLLQFVMDKCFGFRINYLIMVMLVILNTDEFLLLVILNTVRVEGKKVVISEASIRRDLQFADEEGVDCLSNSTIFEQLALMGYEKVKEYQEKDKIGSKPDKNGKRDEAGKSLKQLQ
uniref:Integrase catalytic domain-containing protein n=1 Tax=Tanacetum cinerariifolium TaxID=118510 RepID=A0A699HV16_TANCI|nr:hypothetical protein [Tanacetum cinerariifolium]